MRQQLCRAASELEPPSERCCCRVLSAYAHCTSGWRSGSACCEVCLQAVVQLLRMRRA